MRKLNLIALDEDPGPIAAHLRAAGWEVQVATDLSAVRQQMRSPQPTVISKASPLTVANVELAGVM